MLGRRQHHQHLRVVAGGVLAPAELERQQVGRRAREAEAHLEEVVAAELLRVRRELERLVEHRLREDERREVVRDQLRQVAQQPLQDRHLLAVDDVDQLERPHLRKLLLDRRRARLGARAADAAARERHPAVEGLRRRAHLDRSGLRLQLLELVGEHLLEVGLAHPLVPVREHGEADHDVGVRKLGGGRRHVLAEERDGEKLARGRHVLPRLLGREEAVVDAVDLREHVRQEGVEPRVREVEHLHVLVGEALEQRLGRRDVRLGAVHQVREHLLVLHVAHPLAAEPEHHPAAERRLQLLIVERAGEQDQVRRPLQHLSLEPLRHRRLQLCEHAHCRRVSVPAVRHASAHRVQASVEEVEGHRPPRRPKVERLSLAQRPVELRLQRVQDQIDLVEHEHRLLHLRDDRDGDARLRGELGDHRRPARHHLLRLGAPQLRRAGADDAHQPARRVRRREHVLFVGVEVELEEVDDLDELEHERLDRRRRREHHRRELPRLQQLGEQLRRRGGEAVEVERVHGLLQQRREALPHHRARELEERRRHHLHHEGLVVAEQQSEQRRDDRRLAGAHDHLVDARFARRRRTDELVDEVGLLGAEEEVERVLERQQPGVVRDAAVGVGLAHEDSSRGEELRERRALLHERLANLRRRHRRGGAERRPYRLLHLLEQSDDL